MIVPTSDSRSVAQMIEAWNTEDREEGTLAVMDFETTSTGVKGFKGKSQEPLTADDLDLIDFESDDPLPLVGLDNRVYEMRHGLIECLAAVKLDKVEPDVYVKAIDWSRFPPDSELAYLYKTFFSQYDREVLMLVGWRRDGTGCRYHVPWQEGTTGLVEWKADTLEMGQFQEECHWVGTIHVHPGNDSRPSQTDIDDWAIPEKSGLHLIFGKDGSYTIHGAIAGRTFEIGSGPAGFMDGRGYRIEPRLGTGVITTSNNLPYKALLNRPKPIVVKTRKTRLLNTKRTKVTTKKWATSVETAPTQSKWNSIWDEHLDRVGSLDVANEDTWDLSVVLADDAIHILTPEQWDEFATLCEENALALPKRHSLTLKGGGI